MSDSGYSTNANTSRRCERCGSAVSKQFVRVFGVENSVHGCINCLTRTELAVGEAAMRTEDGEDTGVRWQPESSV
jgi:hypothetical protein